MSQNEVILSNKVEKRMSHRDSLPSSFFVLCMDPLSKKLNLIYPKVEVETDKMSYTSNHLLFIDDLK